MELSLFLAKVIGPVLMLVALSLAGAVYFSGLDSVAQYSSDGKMTWQAPIAPPSASSMIGLTDGGVLIAGDGLVRANAAASSARVYAWMGASMTSATPAFTSLPPFLSGVRSM